MSLVIEESPLAVLPGLATKIGVNGALILQQIHYWLEKSKHMIDGCRWIYNSYESWHQQFPFLSLKTIKRAVAELRALQLLRVERFQKHRWNQTNWYTIDYERLEALVSRIVPTQSNRLGQSVPIDQVNLSQSVTKTSNTEISTRTTTPTHHPVLEEDRQGKIVPSLGLATIPLEETKEAVSRKLPGQEGKEAKLLKPEQIHLQAKSLAPKPHTQSNSTEAETTPDLNQIDSATAEPLLKQVEDLGIRLNQNLRKLVLSATVETIKNALGVLKQNLESRKPLKNPPGLLAEAIKQQWKPSQAQDACTPQKAPADFTEWFNLARDLSLVSGSELKDGVLYVYTPNGKGETWEAMTATYPLAELRSQVEHRQREIQELARTRVEAPPATPLQPRKRVEENPGPQRHSPVSPKVGEQGRGYPQNTLKQSPLPPSPEVLEEFGAWINLALQVGIISDSNIVEGEMLVYSGRAWHEWMDFSATFTTRYLRQRLKEGSIIRRE